MLSADRRLRSHPSHRSVNREGPPAALPSTPPLPRLAPLPRRLETLRDNCVYSRIYLRYAFDTRRTIQPGERLPDKRRLQPPTTHMDRSSAAPRFRHRRGRISHIPIDARHDCDAFSRHAFEDVLIRHVASNRHRNANPTERHAQCILENIITDRAARIR